MNIAESYLIVVNIINDIIHFIVDLEFRYIKWNVVVITLLENLIIP